LIWREVPRVATWKRVGSIRRICIIVGQIGRGERPAAQLPPERRVERRRSGPLEGRYCP